MSSKIKCMTSTVMNSTSVDGKTASEVITFFRRLCTMFYRNPYISVVSSLNIERFFQSGKKLARLRFTLYAKGVECLCND